MMAILEALMEPLEERRVGPREDSKQKTVMMHYAMSQHSGIILNISRNGLRLRSRNFFPCGQEIGITAPAHTELAQTTARIVRQQLIEVDGEEFYEYGVRYTEAAYDTRHSWYLVLRKSA